MKIFFFVSALFTKKNYESRLENSVLFICFSQWRPVEIVSVLLGGFSSKTENQLRGFFNLEQRKSKGWRQTSFTG